MLTLVTFFHHDWMLAVIVAWVASPIMFFVVAYVCEIGENGRGATAAEVFKSVFSPKGQAYSFLIGDFLLLPGALAVAAINWQETSNQVDLSIWWWLACLLVGVVIGFGWHFKLEKPGYEQAGFAANLNSPTKLFHDFVSYPVLFGGIMFVFVPMFFHIEWNFIADLPVILISLAIIIWFVLGAVVDSRRAKRLMPWGHPKYDLENDVCLSPA